MRGMSSFGFSPLLLPIVPSAALGWALTLLVNEQTVRRWARPRRRPAAPADADYGHLAACVDWARVLSPPTLDFGLQAQELACVPAAVFLVCIHVFTLWTPPA
jgi:hypothetical protein